MSDRTEKPGFLRGAFAATMPGFLVAACSAVGVPHAASALIGATAGGAATGSIFTGQRGAVAGGITGAVLGGLVSVFGESSGSSAAIATALGTVFGGGLVGTFISPDGDYRSTDYTPEENTHASCYAGILAGAAVGAPLLTNTLVNAF